MDFDSFSEILNVLTRNKSRTFLTGFGVFWGVFMLVGLVGGGDGLKEILNNNLAGFATNSAVVWAQHTMALERDGSGHSTTTTLNV